MREAVLSQPLKAFTTRTITDHRVLNPEIVLLFKSTNGRPKDRRDLDRTLPLLTDAQVSWLRDAIRELRADHPWLAEL